MADDIAIVFAIVFPFLLLLLWLMTLPLYISAFKENPNYHVI